VSAILAAAPAAPVPRLLPRLLPGAQVTLLLPGDHRYHDPTSTEGTEHYFVLCDGRWVQVRRRAPHATW
jgi:hypothetical protein